MKSEAHILIVDDDEAIRDLLHEFLKKRGMRVSVARDSEEMQDVLARTPIDLLILDVMLPGKSGMEICREIRMHSRIPIIMLTAITETTDRVVGLEMGADDYVSKPFDPRELLARVRAVLRRLDTSAPDRRMEPQILQIRRLDHGLRAAKTCLARYRARGTHDSRIQPAGSIGEELATDAEPRSIAGAGGKQRRLWL